MCGRYYIETEDAGDELRSIIDEAGRRASSRNLSLKTGEIFPTDIVPVVANGRDLVPSVFVMRWGLPLKGGSLVINARSETASMKPMFRDSARLRRCLIPASGYFEWERRGGDKIKYAIRPAGEELLYMGGLYVPDSKSDLALFVILTRPVAERIAFIHDRMPVIVPMRRKDDWLSHEYGLDELLRDTVEDVEFVAV